MPIIGRNQPSRATLKLFRPILKEIATDPTRRKTVEAAKKAPKAGKTK